MILLMSCVSQEAVQKTDYLRFPLHLKKKKMTQIILFLLRWFLFFPSLVRDLVSVLYRVLYISYRYRDFISVYRVRRFDLGVFLHL